jgi:hypothetical protein
MPTPTSDTWPTIYSDWLRGSAAQVTSGPSPDLAYPAGAIADATLGGISANGLLSDPNLGPSLNGATIGRSLHIDSAQQDVPSYELVEVVSRSQVVAIAMLQDLPDGLHFGALQSMPAGAHLPNPASAASTFRKNGINTSSVSLTWGWSPESMSPFEPFWKATDTQGTLHFMTPSGQMKSSMSLANGR